MWRFVSSLSVLFSARPVSLSLAQSTGNNCGVYWAASTLSGSSGHGMFAGRSFEFGEVVTVGDLVVPIVDFVHHNKHYFPNDREEPAFLWDEYTWEAEAFSDMDQEVESDEIYAASFGFGAGANSHVSLTNLEPSDVERDDAGATRGICKLHDNDDHDVVTSTIGSSEQRKQLCPNPGAGAFTYYHGRTGIAARHIPAGMELFLHYGDEYFSGAKAQWGVPERTHLQRGFVLLRRVQRLIDSYATRVSPTPTRNLHDATTHVAAWMKEVYDLIHSLAEVWSSPILRTFPRDMDEVPVILEQGNMRLAHYNQSIRSLSWLQEHGTCMDRLKPGTSTLEHAGRGVFLTHPVRRGETIAPMPLIHLSQRRVLDMFYHLSPNASDNATVRQQHQQLLLNYCWGHAESELLLCPYGMHTSLLNHASPVTAGTKPTANAKLIWSDKHSTHPEWRSQPPALWANKPSAGLAWELVALRDLSAGEEVLVDYGAEWEEAWKRHVDQWQQGSVHHLPDFEWNRNGDSILPENWLPDASLYCHRIFCSWWGLSDDFCVGNDEEDVWLPCRVISRYKDKKTVTNAGMLYNIEILWREQRAATRNLLPDESICVEQVEAFLFGVPREIFKVVDAPNVRDATQLHSFRHDMRIPDELFPEAWKTSSQVLVTSNEAVTTIKSTG